MNLRWKPIVMHYRHPFKIARADTYSACENVIVEIEHEGVIGTGEASPADYMGEDKASVLAGLAEIAAARNELLGEDPMLLEDICARLAAGYPKRAALRCGVELALHDLVCKKLKVPLFRFFGLDPAKAGRTCWTIGIDSPEVMLSKAEEAAGYPLKVKLGTDYDVEIIRDLRAQTREPIRIDGNCGWDVDRAKRTLRAVEKYDIDLCEQPCHPRLDDRVAEVARSTDIPVVADESVNNAADVARLAGVYDGINIKLTKSGGVREAFKMAAVARAHGMVIQIGCMGESSVSITAAAHLTPLVDFVDLDSPLLFADDPYRGVKILPGGQMVLPKEPGLGVSPRRA